MLSTSEDYPGQVIHPEVKKPALKNLCFAQMSEQMLRMQIRLDI